MKQSGRTSPSYLVRNPHSYCFRMFVPTDLQPSIGRKELRFSLRTGYIGLAKHKARYLAGQLHMLFKHLRGSVNSLSKLTMEKIQELVNQYIRQSIDQWDESFYEFPNNVPFIDVEDVGRYLRDLGAIREDLVANLSLGDHSMLTGEIDQLLEDSGIKDIDKKSNLYRKLGVEIHIGFECGRLESRVREGLWVTCGQSGRPAFRRAFRASSTRCWFLYGI